MITPQEIRGKSFDTTLFKGYEMSAVDDYMETLAKEAATLYAKMQKLANQVKEDNAKLKEYERKLEDYRCREEAISTAMVHAQQISVQTEAEARTQAANIVAEAKATATATLGDIDDRIAQEEARLQEAKLITAKFFDSVRTLCQGQIANMDALGMGGKPVAGDDAMRIPAAKINDADAAPAAASYESDNTQVFSFNKEN